MANSSQGVRSSRTGPILKRDRKRMQILDRKITRLDYQIWFHETVRSGMAGGLLRKREKLDAARKQLRLWFKSTPVAKT